MSNNNESAKKLSAKLFAAYETERAMKWLHGQNKEFAEKYPAGTPQPEQGETYWIIKNLLNIISDLKATSPRDWTPCAEGSPDIMRRVIVTASGEIVIASKQHELDDDETTPIHWYDDEGCRFNDDVVTAWIPLPEPWTGGLDGK